MTAPQIRAHYGELRQIETRFDHERESIHHLLATVRQHKDQLQAGGWQGRAAGAFYEAMDGDLLPALARLEAALGQAAQVTGHIRVRIQQAEDGAARVLRGDPAVDGGASRASTPVEVAAGINSGGSAGPSAQGGFAFISAPRPPNPRVIGMAIARRRKAAEDAAVDKLLSIFDPQVRILAKRSPTLRAQILALQKSRIIFLTGPRSQTIEPFITIKDTLTGADAVAMIAHETGHAATRAQQVGRIVETPSMSRDEYVDLNVTNNLRNEAMAQFNALQVRAELLAAGAGDIGVPGDQDPGFQRVYADFAAGRLTRDQAITQMGPLMGNLIREPGPPPQTYRDYAIAFFRQDWDTHVAPLRR